ncbi:MAG: hypothetical protein JWP15_3150 [Alphaproteobacteria bacterium]|nr:hypothetical protein [Alphaproteobacteria bacterium]
MEQGVPVTPTPVRTDHALERLVFFSDAVFAIAITLLVIDVHVPHLSRAASDVDFWWSLARLSPSFVGYAVSFAVIGAFWSGHHRSFLLAGRYDGRIIPWNLALLGAVAFIPFVTAFMSAYSGLRVPTLVYCGWLLVTALLNMRVVRIACGPSMAAHEIEKEETDAVWRRSQSVALGAASAFLLSLFVPMIGQIGLATIPLWRRLLTRRHKAE